MPEAKSYLFSNRTSSAIFDHEISEEIKSFELKFIDEQGKEQFINHELTLLPGQTNAELHERSYVIDLRNKVIDGVNYDITIVGNASPDLDNINFSVEIATKEGIPHDLEDLQYELTINF